MCDCFHLAFPNWHAASSGTGGGRRLRGPEPATEDDSTCDEPSQFTEGERPRPQGSSPVEEFPTTEKYTDSDKECEAEHDPHHKSGSGKKTKKSGLGSMFEKRSTPKMSKLKEVPSPESGVIVKTAKDGCAEGLVYGGGGKEGIFIKEVVPESPASKSLKLKEGDRILSATVYFDNVSYEDAIQILEHAQAYKMKLCLKRNPDITETEPVIDTDVIPEEELYAPEMREQGKTKRRGDARISWPKFPSLGRGKKSHFTRSHSSSEADEQRKLELSPTTSDTESPIKSQDALKGKKKHKVKLSLLTKRGRISSSEDQDTDAPTTGQISGDINLTQESDLLSPECLESPSGETPQVYVTDDLKITEDSRAEQNEAAQHKVELISIDSTLKTTDLTVALADQGSPTGVKSPDGKKKKKERSELKMKILGKDKSHKKDAKAKASPKRLKTLGASFEIADQLESENTKTGGDQPANTQIISSESSRINSEKPTTTRMEMTVPKVELDISDVGFMRKSPQKSEEKTQKKGKDKLKQETKAGPMFKLPKVGLGDIATEETLQQVNVNIEECTTKIEQFTTEGAAVKEDPYERLSKSSVSRTQLPKREDIEIPGMEDVSMKTAAIGIKVPKATFTESFEDIHSETVQLMPIDVDSVKEAVSKLPGFKLPKVDTSGVPIPEEITVIDANAQRISVKTPTKVVDAKTKHETHFIKFDVTASPEISKTQVKLPQVRDADLTSEELLTATKVEFSKPQKEQKTKPKQSDKEIKTGAYKREDIVIPGKESAQTVSILQAQDTEGIKLEYESGTARDSDKKSKKAKITMSSFGITKPDIRIPDIGIDLPKQNISGLKDDLAKGQKTTFVQEVKISKTETRKGKGQIEGVVCDVKIPEIDGIEYIDSGGDSPAKKDGGERLTAIDVNLDAKPKADFYLIRSEVKDVEAEERSFKLPKVTTDISVKVPDADKDINIEGGLEREGKGSKFKMPNVGISMPKGKGPKVDVSLSKKDAAVTLPETKTEITLPQAPESSVTLGSVDVSVDIGKPRVEIKPLQTEGELDGQGSKFKMPQLGIKLPKVKGPEIDLGLSKKDVAVTLPEATAEVKLTDAELKKPSAEVEVRASEIKVAEKRAEGSPLKFKMPTFKLPKFGVATPNISAEASSKIKDTQFPDAQLKSPEGGVAVAITTPRVDSMGPAVDVKTAVAELDEKGSKFKMPHVGFSTPKATGPKIDLSLSKKDVDVTLPEAKADIKLPEVDPGKIDVLIPEVKKPEMEMQVIQTKGELDVQGEKLKMPKFGIKMPKIKGPEFDLSLSKKDADVKVPDAKIDVSLGKGEVLILEEQDKAEHDEQEDRFKMPKLGLSMPKVKGPEFHLGLSKKDVDVTTSHTKAEINLPEVEVKAPSTKVELKAPEIEVAAKDTEGFKMPDFSFSMPKVKGPDLNLSLQKKDKDIALPETEAEVKFPEASKIDVSIGKAEVLMPEANVEVKKPQVQIKPLQTDVELEGQGGKFKMPKFGITMPKVKGPEIDLRFSKKDGNVALPEAKAEVHLPDAPKIAVDMKSPECEAEIDRQGGKFKMPKFGITMPKVSGPETDLSLSKKDVDVNLPEAKADIKLSKAPEADVTLGSVDVSIPKLKMDIEKPEVEIKPLQTEGELDGQGTKFKMPKLGITMPKVKGPEVDLRLSKKDVDMTLPEAKAEVSLPGADIKQPSAEVEMKAAEMEAQLGSVKGSPSKFKLPTLKFPKFGVATPNVSVEVPDADKGIKTDEADINIDLPEVKAEVQMPEIEVKEPSGGIVLDPGVEVDAKLRRPRFSLPRFSFSKPSVKVPEVEVSSQDVNVEIPEGKVEVTGGKVDMKPPECEVEVDGQDSKFKIPKFGITMPKVSGPETDLSFSKKDVEVTLPEAKAKVQLPEVPEADVTLGSIDASIPKLKLDVKKPQVEIKPLQTEGELDGQGTKIKMPKLGIKMPKVKGPEMDLSLSKKDVDVTLPEVKAEVKVPDVELKKPSAEVDIKAPEIKVVTKDTEESPSKFKMPSFKIPKFGVSIPSATAELDKDIKIEGADIKIPEEVLTVNVAAPSIDTKAPSIDVKTPATEPERRGSRFKLPSFGFSGPQVKGPEIDLSLTKKEVDVTLPEVKAEVKVPDVKLKKPSAEVDIKAPEIKVATKDTEGSPSKYKKPTITLPKLGLGSLSATAEMPDMEKDIKIEGADIKIPEKDVKVSIAEPSIDVKGPSIDVKTKGAEPERRGSRFKLPSFGFSGPQVKGPEIDLSLSKKEVDVTLPEVKAEVKVPDVELKKPSAEVDIKTPEIKVVAKDTEESPSKFKMPSFKIPKFGVSTPSATAELDKDIKVDGADIKIPEEVLTVSVAAPSIDTKGPSIDVKTTGTEPERRGSRFKLPSFGFSGPQVKGPEIDLSLSKKEVDVTLPEVKAEVKVPDVELKKPSAEVDIKTPEIKVVTKDTEESPSKFKMPSFKIPKFGVSTPSATAELDKDIKVDGADMKIPEEVLTVSVAAPSIDTKGPSIDVKTTGTEPERRGSRFKLPSLGFSGFQAKGPEIDLSLSKKEVDVTLPEVKAEVKVPDVELKKPSAEVDIKAPEIKVVTKDTEGSPSKYKLPTLKLPKLGLGSPSTMAEMPDMEKDIKIEGADIKIPEKDLEVSVAAPSIDIKAPSIDVKTKGVEPERRGSRFKLPSFGFSGPQVKGPEVDLSLSKKDVDVTLPEVKAEVKVPDVELKKPSAEVDIKAPEIKVATKDTEESPSKFKMPTFKIPKFGISVPSATADLDKDIKIDGADIKIPEEVLTVSIAAPSIDTKAPSIDVKTSGAEPERRGSRFKLPSFGFSGPQVKGPEVDLSLSKKEVDVTLPEVKAEVKVPDVKLKKPSAEVDIKAPEIKVATKDTEGSPSKYKMPTITLPKLGLGSLSATAEMPDMEKDIKIEGADIKIPEKDLKVSIAAPSIDVKAPSIDVKTTGTEPERRGSRFKLPSFGFSGPQVKEPEVDLSMSKKEVDVTLPEVKAEVKVPDVKLKKPSAEVDIKAPEIKVVTKDTEESPSKYKMPTFKLPKLGLGTPSATADLDKDIKVDGADIKIPEEVLTVSVAAPSIDTKGPSIDVKTSGAEPERRGSRFKLPSFGFSGPQVKGPEIDLSLSKKEVDVTLPEVKAEVKVPDVELKKPSAEVDIKAPEIKVVTKDTEGSPSKYKMPTFKLPKLGLGSPSTMAEMPEMEKDIKIEGADIKIPEKDVKVSVAAPSVNIKAPSIDVKTPATEPERRGSRFKLPSFGFSGPQVKGPEIDLSLSKKEVDVTLPEVKAEVKVPDVELKKPSAEVGIKAPEIKVVTKDTEGSPSKYKMPTFKLPKLGLGTPSATADLDKDIKIDGADIKIPEEVLTVSVAAPSIDTKGPSIDVKTTGTEPERRGSRFKLPSFGFSGPQVKGPEIDLSLSKKEVDVTLPEVKAEVKVPDVKLKKPSAEVDIKAPEIKVVTKDTEGSPSKYKMPTIKLPKLGLGSPSATAEMPEMDKDIKIDGADIKIPEKDLKVSIAAPSIDVKAPSIDVKTIGTEPERRGSRFKLPSFGFSGPQVKGPEIDLSLTKKEVDVTLPEVKAEVKVPDVKLKKPSAEVDIKAPEIKVVTKDTEGSPSKYKMPTIKLPKLGLGSPSATAEMPEMDKDIKIEGADIKIPEKDLKVSIAAPSIDVKAPSIDVKTTGTEPERRGSRFKLPSFGFSGPQVKEPEVDLSMSKKEVDVTLPEVKAEVKVPDVKLKKPSAEVDIKAPEIKVVTKDTEESPSKYKMPTFKLPKLGLGTPSATADLDKDIKVDGADIKIPEEVLTVSVAAPSIDIKAPSIDVKTPATEPERRGSRFKLPSFGFSGPQVKGPEIDLSLTKKEVDVTLPEVKGEVKVPDVRLDKAETEAPGIDLQTRNVEGSPSKFKMSTFKLPKFGATSPQVSVEVPDIDEGIKVEGADLKLQEAKAEVKLPDVEIKEPAGSISQAAMTEGDAKLRKSSWTMPRFSFSKASGKAPDADIKLDVSKIDISVAETKTDVHLPDIDIQESSKLSTEGGTSVDLDAKFKKPRFSLPRLSFSKQTTKELEGDVSLPKVDISLPEENVEVKQPDIDFKSPEGEVKLDGQDSKTKIKAPEVQARTGNVEGSPSKFKMPTITLPTFGAGTPKVSVEVPDMDKGIKPDTKASMETQGLSLDVKAKGGELEGSGGKIKMPNINIPMPKVQGPEIDLSLSKKDIDVTLPEAKAEVKGPSGAVSVEEPPAPDSDINSKKPRFSLPRFSFSKPSIKEPEVSAELSSTGVSLPEGEVIVKQPEMETKGPDFEAGHDGKGSPFKLPKLGFVQAKAKEPEVDVNVSQKDLKVTLPEVKAEVKLSGVEVKESSTNVEMKSKGSPLKFKPPTGKMPKFGSATDDVTSETPTAQKEAEIDGAKLKGDVTVTIKGPSFDMKTDSSKAVTSDSEMPKTETDGVGQGSPSKFKLPSFKMPRLSFSKPKPEDEYIAVDTKMQEDQPDMEVKPKGEIKSPKLTLASLGEVLKTIDVEFNVPKVEETLETSKKAPETKTDEPTGKESDAKEKETKSKQETITSPEKTGWFKFPKYGLSSPSEPPKISKPGDHKDEKSPVGDTVDEEISPTCSVQSSDAFADVSSTATSEPVGPSSSSPTKVTVKYSDPNAAAGPVELHSNIITSTTHTELISAVPDLPEKITILSSGVSSSSEDTTRLESGKIHIITSNIQAAPEAQHAKRLTAVQVQSAGGLALESGTNEAASWTVEDSHSSKRTVFERQLVRETSSERSESKETVIITKQITHVFESSEPISGETATSIQRLRDSVHSEKMKFFDGAEK